MSKFPKISGKQMIKYLQNEGFIITQRKGSHATLRNGNIITVVPVGNKKMRVKTQFAILLYANISKEKFIDDHENKLTK
ncbi:MAG: HicA toxin domain-containing protein [Cenarchaeum symbiont of Oopsacas minuta]|nr:HicA toxin domain-containing protein [Cenarchaeum symbiont of Oopsacas minuta]